MTLYTFTLSVHNILRWVVLILGLIAVIRAYRGWLGKRDWTESDRKFGVFFTMALDIQVLLGLILYFFLSPFTRSIFTDLASVTGNMGGESFFYSFEHIFVMIVAVALAHIGSARSKKALEPSAKHRQAAIFFTLAILAILIGVPWKRAWLRLGAWSVG